MSKILSNLFKDIQSNPEKWHQAKKGSDFEDLLEMELKKVGLTNIIDKDEKNRFLTSIKGQILDKLSEKNVLNPLREQKGYTNCFISQPFGSQNYPDFFIFGEKFVVPIEVKYSKSKSINPVWNSNLPKANGVYIFGSYGHRDITFFRGNDVLPQEERELLIDFFEKDIIPQQQKFRDKLKKKFEKTDLKFSRGFDVYVRRAYNQDQQINTQAELNFFTAKDRRQIEDKLIKYLASLE